MALDFNKMEGGSIGAEFGKSLNENASSKTKGKKVEVVPLISWIVLFLVIISTLAIFIYSLSVDRNIGAREANIAEYQEAFRPSVVQELIAFGTSAEVVKNLLLSRVYSSYVFRELETFLISTANIKSLSVQKVNNEVVELSFNGETRSYIEVLQQANIFETSEFFRGGSFSNIRQTTGNGLRVVSFSYTKVIPISLLQQGIN